MRPNILSKLVIACLCVLLTSILVNAQSVGMSGTAFTPDSDAILELKAIDKGFLLPRMTTGQRTTYTAAANSGAGLGAAEEGMSIYNSSTNEYNVWDGTQWVMIGGTTSGAGFIENQMAAAQSAADFWIDGKGIVDVLGVGTTAALSSRVHIHDASATAGESLLLIDDNASSPVLQVQDIGRVGIGTASPVSTLDVVGKGTVQFGGDVLVLDPGYVSGASLALGTLATPDTYLRFGNSGGTLNYLDTKGHDFHLYSTATTPGLYFQESDGFVGIGTSTPLAPLHVENDVVNNTIQDVLRLQNHASAGGNGGAIQFRSHWNNGGSFWTMGRVAAIEQNGFGGQLVFYTNEGTGSADDVTPEAMRINENGNLGIGSTNPTEHLHVVSPSNGDGTWDEGIHIENTGTTAGEAALSFSNISTGTNYWMTGLNQSDDYDIAYGTTFTNANTKLRIQDNGFMGVGTISPSQVLDVNGKIRMRTGGTSGYIPVSDANGVMTWTSPAAYTADDQTLAEVLIQGNNAGSNSIDMDANNILDVNYVQTRAESDYDKLRVYSSSSYTIGMHSGMTMGDLNDWAMTFTMNNDSDRGFVWRDVNDAVSDGAMALTTAGELTIKGNVEIGTSNGSGSDLYLADRMIDWDNSTYYIDPGGVNRVNEIMADDGSASDVAYHFNGDDNTGLYQPANNEIGFSVNGTQAGEFDASRDFKVMNLAGTGNRPVYVDASGTLQEGRAVGYPVSFSSNMRHSPDDVNGTTLSGDDNTTQYNLPFNFNIGGTTYTWVRVSTNGWVAFGETSTNSELSNECLPDNDFVNPVVCAYWDDLVTEDQNIEIEQGGTAPGRVVTIKAECRTYSGSNDVNYEVMIHEKGMITVNYWGNMASGSIGQSATIGFQMAGGSSAVAFPISCNEEVIDDNDERQAWSIYIPQDN